MTEGTKIDTLPDRYLTVEEVEEIQESDAFEKFRIQGRDITAPPYIVEAIEAVVDGEEKVLWYEHGRGWVAYTPEQLTQSEQ